MNVNETVISVTPSLLQNVLRASENDVHLEVIDIKTAPLTKKGDNYTSIILAVEVLTKSDAGEKTICMVAKLAPSDVGRKKYLEMVNFFPKETEIYNIYLPELIEFQKRHDVQDVIIPAVPKNYNVGDEEKRDILLFQNLKLEDYMLCDKFTGADYDHCVLVMKELAYLHALSYALIQETKPIPILEKFPCLYDYFSGNKEFLVHKKAYFDKTMNMTIETLESLGDKYKELLQKFTIFKNNTDAETMFRLAASTDGTVVVIHGDCWINNMMFKYENEKPKSVKLFDFQLTRVADCCVDLQYFFNTSTTKELRVQSMTALLGIYHATFQSTIKSLIVEEPVNFTLVEFLAHYNTFKPLGLLYACALLPFMLARPEETIELGGLVAENEMEYCIEMQQHMLDAMGDEPQSKKPFLKRLIGVIEDMVRDGII